MNLSRGDVILRQGKFALVWNSWPGLMRVFPIEACDEVEIDDRDVIFSNWHKFNEIARTPTIAIRIAYGRIESPYGWVKVPDLALTMPDMIGVASAINRYAFECGIQITAPLSGVDEPEYAPIWAN
jgi:hypothetical protein